jgi:AraC family transcriptional regulator
MGEAESSDPVSTLSLEGMVLELLAQVDRARLPEISRTAWLTRVRDYLDSHAGEGPLMDRLGDLAGVHPVHLARAFRRAFGCSIGAYVRRLQVERAMTLLTAGELSLAEVAATTGFSDQSHMTRLVRAQTGTTPGAWRRRLS